MTNQIKIEQLSAILEVLQLAEKLKFDLRHSWLSNGRQESVAEHTWRMSLMAVLIFFARQLLPGIEQKSIHLEKLYHSFQEENRTSDIQF